MDENLEAMNEQIKHVSSGEITYSVRDTEINGVKITAGDYMGITDGEIVISVKEEKDALSGLLQKMITDEAEIITFFCGKDAKEEDKANLEKMCLDINPDLDVEIIDGKQDIYSYIIAVE